MSSRRVSQSSSVSVACIWEVVNSSEYIVLINLSGGYSQPVSAEHRNTFLICEQWFFISQKWHTCALYVHCKNNITDWLAIMI